MRSTTGTQRCTGSCRRVIPSWTPCSPIVHLCFKSSFLADVLQKCFREGTTISPQACRRADFGSFPGAIWPKSGTEARLNAQNIIAELRGLVRREGQRPVQSWPRAHVVGCGSQRLSMSVFTHLGRRGGSFALPIQLGRAAFLNRSGSRRAASPPPSTGCVIPLSSHPRSSTRGPGFTWAGQRPQRRPSAPGPTVRSPSWWTVATSRLSAATGFVVRASFQPSRGCSPPLADSIEPRPLGLGQSPRGFGCCIPTG